MPIGKALLLCAACAFVAACTPFAPEPMRTLVPALVPGATPEPAPAADPSALVPEGGRLVSALETDTDGDGKPDLVVFYLQRGEGRALVLRRGVESAYPLLPPAGSILFRERLDPPLVRDVTGDGKPEIVVEGALQGTAETVHVFQWNGRAYANVLSLAGTQGVASDDPQGNGVLDFTALETLFQRSAIFRATNAEWTGAAYALRTEVLFVFGSPALSRHPEETALEYYQAWGKRDPQTMWALLDGAARTQTSLAGLEAQTRSAEGVRVESMRIEEESESEARVSVEVRLTVRGAETAESHVWRLARAAGGKWRIMERAQ